MKRISALFCLILSTNIAFATPPEIHTWQQYPTLNISEEVPVTETVTLVPIWALDCGADSAELMGKIITAAPGLDGRTLLLDSQLVQVLVVGPDGAVERTAGQEGEGPGDFPGAYRTLQLSDGRIGVCGGAPAMVSMFGGMGKIILLDADDDPAGLWYAAGEPSSMPLSSVRELRCANDHVLVASQYAEVSESSMVDVFELALLDAVDGRRTTVARCVVIDDMKSTTIREADFYEPFAYGRCDISTNGRVAFSPVRDQWLVVIREPGGDGLVLSRQWRATRRTEAQKEVALTMIGSAGEGFLFKNQPAVGRIRWRPDGKLWVEVLQGNEAVFAVYDEFSPSGELLRRVRVEAPGDPTNDKLVVMENGRFALLRGFENVAEGEEDLSTEAGVLLLEIAQ